MGKIKFITFFAFIMLFSTVVSSQKYEMILFSGDYHCCQSGLWESFEKTVGEIAHKSIKRKDFVFRVVKVSDIHNKVLVETLGGVPQKMFLRNIHSPSKSVIMSEFSTSFLVNNDRVALKKAIKKAFIEIK